MRQEPPNFSLKKAMGFFSCKRTAPMPIPLAPVSTSNNFSKSGRARIGASKSHRLMSLNAFLAWVCQVNSPFFFHQLGDRCHNRTKILNDSLVERSQSMKTSNFVYILWFGPYGLLLPRINSNSVSSHDIP